jgi:hypothetical protein
MFARTCTRVSLIAALALLAASAGARAGSEENASLAAPYALEASQQTLASVLNRFAVDHGLTLRAAGNATADWHATALDGWLRAPSGRAFLEQLAEAHHFSWFIAERVLYLSSSRDAAVERIELDGVRADSARAALDAVGIYDARFGWGELPGKDAVLVGGPRAYRALVRRFLASHTNTKGEQPDPGPMIFPLRFAKAANDPPSNARGADRPGVAALLRQLLAGDVPSISPAFALADRPDVPPLPASPPPFGTWIGFPSPASTPLPTSSSAPSIARRLRAARSAAAELADAGIVADEGTNSVIVWADRRWRGRLQQLVDALDRPSPLVSMEVLVVEGDASAVAALTAVTEPFAHSLAASHPSTFHEQIDHAVDARRIRLLNRQTLVGRTNAHVTLAIGEEVSRQGAAAADTALHATRETINGRDAHRGDRLDLAARVLPSNGTAALAIAVDVDLLMAQPTGLPGQPWANTSSVKLDTGITLESGAPPRLIASYPVATARSEQRAIFISAKAL